MDGLSQPPPDIDVTPRKEHKVAPRPNVPVWQDDTFHPARLGKHRDFVDLRFPYDNVREDHSKGEPEHADKHRDYKPITSNRGLAKSFGFGLNAVWPPFDPGSSRNEFEGELTRHGDLVRQHWQRLNRLVLGSEKEIQDAIIKLSQRDFKDANGKTPDIEHCLNLSWAAARDEYNVHHATETGKFTGGFRLDPKGDRHYPIYRNGANYMFEWDAFDNLVFQEDAFQKLKKPGPTTWGKIKYNLNVEDFLEKNRASFLCPHINVLDLTNTTNLFTFIHNRARFLPREFVFRDHDAMYMGACVRILAGAYDPTCSVYFKAFTDKNEDGFPVKPLFLYQHREEDVVTMDLSREGQLLHSMGGWLALQSQAITYLFLSDFCEQMLRLAEEKTIDDPLNSLTHKQILHMETTAAKTIKRIRGDTQIETLDDIEAIRQYEPTPDGTDIQRYEELLMTQKHEAEQHVSILFDDPDYFARAIIEEKEHHWTNLSVGYDNIKPDQLIQDYADKPSLRHILYLDCMRTVLQRAFFEFFIWDAVWSALDELKRYESFMSLKPSEIRYIGGGKSRINLRSRLSEAEEEEYLNNQRQVQFLLRQAATFFVFEFRKKAIHAASSPMRDTYCIPNDANKPSRLPESYYTTPDIKLNFRHQASNEERSQIPRMVLEMIENFISNESSSVLVQGTIKGLNILSEIVDHMDYHEPDAFQNLGRKLDMKLHLIFTEELKNQNSYDLLALDGCAFGPLHVPTKRMARIYSYLDEIQGIGSRKEKSYGHARGDIKRFGSSLLKGLIFPLARMDKHLVYNTGFGMTFKASEAALERLTRHMKISEDQWPFYADEKPLEILDEVNKANPKHYQGIWQDLKDAMRELNKKNQKKLKKPWNNSSKSANAFDFVADEVKLAEGMEVISKRRMRDCVTKRKIKKNAVGTRRKQQEAARQRAVAANNVVMQDAIDQNAAPDAALPPEVQDEPEDVEETIQPMDIDAEDELELEEEPEPLQIIAPSPVARDYGPRLPLNKGCWETWDTILSDKSGIKPKVTYKNLENALNAIGFEPKSKSGSHLTFSYKRGFPPLRGVTGLTVVKPHGSIGESSNVPPPILSNWRYYIKERGLTLEKLEERFSR
ncbi:unnamed protein product [Fusarium graminearum]|nr:unnamed protein product [Fusarium graminearum]CAG1999071.1 unnamed protein product [Fusarium graminearum]